MDEVEQAWELRRVLGRDLKAQRLVAGLTQSQLARRTGYSRSTIATLESASGGAVARAFWERCDRIFGTGEKYAQRWDEIQQHVQAARALAAASRRGPGPRRPVRAGTAADQRALQALQTADPGPDGMARALAACAQLGWPATPDPAGPQLMTGTVLDALEVPRAAGMLAAQWWLQTGGASDPVRGLPTLARPDHALAAITTGTSVFFLTRAGLAPWSSGPPPPAPAPAGKSAADATHAPGPVVRWHSSGSSIPLPPGPDADGGPVSWAKLPPRHVVLGLPAALLDLLAKAVSATHGQTMALRLPGDVLAVPASRSPSRPARH